MGILGYNAMGETEICRISLEIWQEVIGDSSPRKETDTE